MTGDNIKGHKNNLKRFSDINSDEISNLQIKKLNPPSQDKHKVQLLKEELRELLTQIATDAIVTHYEWQDLRNYLAIAIKDSLYYMDSKYPDTDMNGGLDSFDDILGDLIELFLLFDKEPPFTIQRICELIIEPEKYYKSSNKYCYAMEKVAPIS